MIRDGRHELAANYLRWAQTKLPDSPRLNESRRLAYLKLMEKYQEFNPFKLIVYAGEINQPVVQIRKRQGHRKGDVSVDVESLP